MLRNIYRTLLNDSSAPSCAAESQVDERVTSTLLDLNDPSITLDLRRMNGNPHSTMFNRFWEEMQAYFDETTMAVDERRHGDALHMPFAVSLRHLRDTIQERLLKKFPDSDHPIPSLEWIRLQF